uniref:Peritrophin-44 n=1 Tax=Zeugodacus cucurbitae TaxID=28588 RepID=A0A0A1XAV7_ZEUCU
MDNNIKKMTLIILLWLSLSLRITSADIFEECENVPKETFVKSLQSCQMYIYCDDNDSYSAECDEGQYFDGDACDDAENVYCPLDESGEADPGDPVESEEPEYPEEPEETVAPVTSKPIITTTTTQSPQTTTKNEIITSTLEPIAIAPVVRDHCPTVEDPNTIVFTANTQSCTSYYLCYHGQAIDMRCTDNLHFNIHTAKCDFPEKVQCMIDRPNANKCLPHVTDFFPHPQKCNYFYYCIKGFLTVQQCPFYYGWDIERRSCVLLDQAKCFVGSKRT